MERSADDLIYFGRLIEAVDTLKKVVTDGEQQTEKRHAENQAALRLLEERLQALERDKAKALGILLGGGSLGGAVTSVIFKMFGGNH